MRLRAGINVKSRETLQVGEWVRVETMRHHALAWVCGQDGQNGHNVVVFDIAGAEHPKLTYWPGTNVCLSFGTECVIEPVGLMAAFAPPNLYRNHPGVLTLAADGAFLTVVDHRQPFHDTFELNIETCEVRQEFAGTLGYITQWRLWESEEERKRPGAEPLLNFTAAPPEGA